jgi:hypothetical protein
VRSTARRPTLRQAAPAWPLRSPSCAHVALLEGVALEYRDAADRAAALAGEAAGAT